MAKESGLGANYYLGEYNLSGDSNSFGPISKSIATLDLTGVDKEAYERLAGKLDAEISWVSFWNPTNSHLALKVRSRNDMIGSYFHRTTIGSPVASCVGKQLTYDPSRAADGGYTANVQILANAWWMDWGKALTTSPRTDTGATNGTGVDFSAAGSFGLQAYLHVVSFTGTSATVKLQQSSDNGSGDAWADVTGGGFTTVTGATSERIATARDQAVERYLRVVTTGTFSELEFVVQATVNRTDMTI